MQFEPGDFFKDALPGADVLVMGMILHDWNLNEKRTLLKKAYDALPDGGSLIVYEHLIDDERRNNVAGLLMSLMMLIETQEGFDYTGAECCGWMREVGSKLWNLWRGFFWPVELVIPSPVHAPLSYPCPSSVATASAGLVDV